MLEFVLSGGASHVVTAESHTYPIYETIVIFPKCFIAKPRTDSILHSDIILMKYFSVNSLQWRHNERDGVSNHRVFIVCSSVDSGPEQRKHQSSASLAFVRGIHRWPVNSPHKRSATRKVFPVDDVIMIDPISVSSQYFSDKMFCFLVERKYVWYVHIYLI